MESSLVIIPEQVLWHHKYLMIHVIHYNTFLGIISQRIRSHGTFLVREKRYTNLIV